MKTLYHLKATLILVATSAALSGAGQAATLTLINSNAQAQVARSGIPSPNNLVQNDPFGITINEPQLGGFSTADALTGIMRFRTSTNGISGVTATTNSVALNYTFLYTGTSPLVLGAGALSYRATSTMSRDLGTRAANDPTVSAQTQINSTLVSQAGFGGNVAGNARAIASDASNGTQQFTPIQSNTNVGLTINQLDRNGLDAIYESVATTLMDGETLQFQVTMSGNASQSGVNPNAIFGVNATTDGSSTGVLNLVLPAGVSVGVLRRGNLCLGLPTSQSQRFQLYLFQPVCPCLVRV